MSLAPDISLHISWTPDLSRTQEVTVISIYSCSSRCIVRGLMLRLRCGQAVVPIGKTILSAYRSYSFQTNQLRVGLGAFCVGTCT